ncbi:hypothetical protein CEXT_147161 [Caerostris extrusa]|uniref:Uncharacterized protein n=1 Tax=Caerostris extrusa TaxID=172846 RepID=A0AAV4Y2D7_CAEEX|nr:hypothetical protein CEXT_147161 [Caerostris extrusa]
MFHEHVAVYVNSRVKSVPDSNFPSQCADKQGGSRSDHVHHLPDIRAEHVAIRPLLELLQVPGGALRREGGHDHPPLHAASPLPEPRHLVDAEVAAERAHLREGGPEGLSPLRPRRRTLRPRPEGYSSRISRTKGLGAAPMWTLPRKKPL